MARLAQFKFIQYFCIEVYEDMVYNKQYNFDNESLLLTEEEKQAILKEINEINVKNKKNFAKNLVDSK